MYAFHLQRFCGSSCLTLEINHNYLLAAVSCRLRKGFILDTGIVCPHLFATHSEQNRSDNGDLLNHGSIDWLWWYLAREVVEVVVVAMGCVYMGSHHCRFALGL